MNYQSSKYVREYFGISAQTLKNWKDSKRIQIKYLSPRKILYDIDSVKEFNINNFKSDNELKAKLFDKILLICNQYKNNLDK